MEETDGPAAAPDRPELEGESRRRASRATWARRASIASCGSEPACPVEGPAALEKPLQTPRPAPASDPGSTGPSGDAMPSRSSRAASCSTSSQKRLSSCWRRAGASWARRVIVAAVSARPLPRRAASRLAAACSKDWGALMGGSGGSGHCAAETVADQGRAAGFGAGGASGRAGSCRPVPASGAFSLPAVEDGSGLVAGGGTGSRGGRAGAAR